MRMAEISFCSRALPLLVAVVLAAGGCAAAGPPTAGSAGKVPPEEAVQIRGIALPQDGTSMDVLTSDGRKKVRWNDRTRVGLNLNYRQLGNVQNDVIALKVHSSSQRIDFKLPPGPKYATKTVRPHLAEKTLKEALDENWLSAHGLSVTCTKVEDHLPTRDEPFFGGKFEFARGRGKPARLIVGDKAFEVSMKKGGQTNVLVYGLLSMVDVKPYVNKVTVIGRAKSDAILSDEMHVNPVGDQAAADDPKLPRLLFVGDSISGNYGSALKAALKGKVNCHHPPTNCGPSGKGVGNIVTWMGAHHVKGRHWDVISFNFGHWDAGNTKEKYQQNLEAVIAKMKETGAKLIWVTTCPVPNGNEKAGELSADGKAPGRKAGVMDKYLNPWALEVMKRHPEILICDQWQFVKEGADGLYAEWWKGKNVHFGGKPATELGRLLARRVMTALGKDAGAINPPAN